MNLTPMRNFKGLTRQIEYKDIEIKMVCKIKIYPWNYNKTE